MFGDVDLGYDRPASGGTPGEPTGFGESFDLVPADALANFAQ